MRVADGNMSLRAALHAHGTGEVATGLELMLAAKASGRFGRLQRVYIDTLFLDGALRPVPFDHPEKLPEWAKVGVVVDPIHLVEHQLEKVFMCAERAPLLLLFLQEL